MDQQLNLFDMSEFEKTSIKVIDGNSDKNTDPNHMLKCYKTQLIDVEYKTLEELFSGFTIIKAITFSYDIGFIDKIMEHFKYGEILLGADFLVKKDAKLNEFLAEIHTNVFEAGHMIKKHENLVRMVSEDNLFIHTPTFIMDHRKLYLLKDDEGHTRVIVPSANMSSKAWNGEHMEDYSYDDSLYCYEEFEKDFETVWNDSVEIPYSVISSKKADDLIDGNAILKDVKETGRTVVLQQPSKDEEFEIVKYTLDHERIKEDYKVLLEGATGKSKNGVYEIVPKTIEKIVNNKRKLQQRRKVNIVNVEKHYPMLTYDYGEQEAYLDGEKLDIKPPAEEVKKDIDELLEIFNNFNEFIDEEGQLKFTHYKMMNVIFASPFIAKLRCTALLTKIGRRSLPLFLIAASSQANSGKTFTIRVALKMMTGKDLVPINKEECKKDDLRNVQVGVKGTPYFVDELDNSFLARIKDLIKHPEKCEERQLESQPMILFASNDVIEPDETVRKRMAFIKFSGALPSNIDQNAYDSRGNAIIARLGTAFYREYTRRMLAEISNLLDYMIHTKHIPDTWYPDIFNISSKVITSIFKDYDYPLPEYIKELTWNDDYDGANCISMNTISSIRAEYKHNKKAFIINKETVTIELSGDKESGKKLESWKNTLPAEMKAKLHQNRDSSRLTVDRKELEKRIGFKFKSFSIFQRS